MSAQPGLGESPNYFSQLVALIGLSVTQLVRPPSSSRRAEAARGLARRVLLLILIVGSAIVVLMYAVDASEIGLMPPRRTAGLWPVRILTDFGKAAYVLWTLAALLFAVAIVSPRLRATQRSPLLRFGTHLQFLFFAVLVPVLAGRFSVVKPTPSTLRILPEPRPMRASRRVMPSRAPRWRSRFPPSGHRRGFRWWCMLF